MAQMNLPTKQKQIHGHREQTCGCQGGWGKEEGQTGKRVGRASLVAQMVKNQPAMQETWVRSLGWEDPLEEGMATHSSILAWRIPQTEDPGRLQSMGLQRVRLY